MPKTNTTPMAAARKLHATYPFPADWHPVAAELGRLVLMVLVLAGVFALLGFSGDKLFQTALGGAAVWRLAFGLATPRHEGEG